jgi:RND family efflux transporter MFP subunit
VLQRAQRSLDMAERRYEHTKVNNDLWWKHTFPDRETDINDSVRWKTQQLDHTRIRQQLTRIRWEIDKAQEQRSLDDLQERLDELQADREGLVVKAPIDGILTRISLEPGDTMGMNQSVAQVRDPSAMVLEGSIDAADLAIVSEGMKVTIEADAFPGLSLPGSVETIGLIGKPSGSGTSFSIEIALDGTDDRLRLGLACTANANHAMRNVISVPNDAVHTADDRTYVMLKQGENTVEQDVVTGLGNDDSIEIVSGLKSGDKIVISTAKDED